MGLEHYVQYYEALEIVQVLTAELLQLSNGDLLGWTVEGIAHCSAQAGFDIDGFPLFLLRCQIKTQLAALSRDDIRMVLAWTPGLPADVIILLVLLIWMPLYDIRLLTEVVAFGDAPPCPTPLLVVEADRLSLFCRGQEHCTI